MASAAIEQNPKNPHAAPIPSQVAPAAPGKPTRARVWPAKAWRRRTMNQPIAPAATATTVPARKALTMKWKANSWRVSVTRFQVSRAPASASITSTSRVLVAIGVICRWLRLPDDDEASVRGLQHLDRRSEQTRERRGGD